MSAEPTVKVRTCKPHVEMASNRTSSGTPPQWKPSFNPWLIAVSVMLATVMEVLDTSVANVALPHIAGNLSATTGRGDLGPHQLSHLERDHPARHELDQQIRRPQTISDHLHHHLYARVRACAVRRRISTILIIARILQGMGGGALQPIAQAVLLESFPPAKRGAAMAVYGMGIVVAPIIGPTLGGWITDNYSWRWIFYINLPIGAARGLYGERLCRGPAVHQEPKAGQDRLHRLRLMALGLGALELTLDLGQQRDWFESSLIVFTATVSATVDHRVHRLGAVHRRADRESARLSQPQLRGRLRADRVGRRRAVRVNGAAAVVSADAARLPGDGERPRGQPARCRSRSFR